MARRPSLIGFFGAFLFMLIGGGAVASASAPVLVSAVSRMTHGTAGKFDIQLPFTGGSGIECRDVTGGMTLVLTFDQTVTGGAATINIGTATISGAPVFATNTLTVALTGVADAQVLNLNVTNVTNAANETLVSADVPFRVLMGDVNGTGSLTGADVNIVKAAVGNSASVNGGTFRCDYNHSGTLLGSDVNLVKAAVGNSGAVAGGATNETPPTITSIPNQSVVTGVPSTPAGFTVGDAESDPATLYATATSSDQTTIPDANIAITGTGVSRTLSLTPAAGVNTVVPVTITVTVSDGLMTSTPAVFTVNVTPPPAIYLATLQPIAGVKSLGSGSATLSVSGDKTYAVLRYSYSNLSSGDTDDAVYAPGDSVLYDIPVGKIRGDQQADGSFKWVFSASNIATVLSTIQGNNAYVIIESATYPAGELKGIFKRVNGSQTFTPPADPPSITINPPTKYDASRFLQQAAFGGKAAEIASLSDATAGNAATALNDWLTAQFAMPGPIYPNYAAAATQPATQPANPPATTQPTLAPLTAQSTTQPYTASSMYYQIWGRVCVPQAPLIYGDALNNDRIHEAWWKNAVTAPDQLRQRVATALSEIFVVSENDSNVNNNLPGLASYYDMLANDAFVNFRQLMEDVTLHPIMGVYLTMKGNKKATPPASPNENYAREVMQLFTIGLYQLQPDGTLVLDQNGQPIPTYDQTTITNFAQVFTGWDQDNNKVIIPTIPSTTQPVAPVVNFTSFYQKPMVITASNHSLTSKSLLVYAGAATYTAATQPSYIPVTTKQTSDTANAELKFALDNIFNHPNVGPFVATKLIQRLVGSNPSPGYVYRVAKVFNNDGTGARGNMQAVIAAILTDYEARTPTLLTDPGYGHCREPMIRIASILRSCGGFSKTNKWLMGKTDTTLSQTVLRSPTVFNFFDPKYSDPGVVSDAGIVSPELAIIFATTVTSSQNMIYTGIYSPNYTVSPPTGTGFRGDSAGSDIYLDFSAAGCGLQPLAQTSGTDAMLDQTALLLMGAPMDPSMKSTISTFINGKISATDYLTRVKAAVHLIATSSQAAVEK